MDLFAKPMGSSWIPSRRATSSFPTWSLKSWRSRRSSRTHRCFCCVCSWWLVSWCACLSPKRQKWHGLCIPLCSSWLWRLLPIWPLMIKKRPTKSTSLHPPMPLVLWQWCFISCVLGGWMCLVQISPKRCKILGEAPFPYPWSLGLWTTHQQFESKSMLFKQCTTATWVTYRFFPSTLAHVTFNCHIQRT